MRTDHTSIRLLTPEYEHEYQEFIRGFKGSVFHHRLEWRDLLTKALGLVPRFLVAHGTRGITGCLCLFQVWSPIRGKRLLSSPLCRRVPILAESHTTALKLVDAALGLARATGCKSVEIRSGKSFPKHPKFEQRTEFVNYVLDLDRDIEQVWHSLHPRSVRPTIRKAARQGVTVHSYSGCEVDAYMAFHTLAVETRKRQGAPPMPREFYDCLADMAGQSGTSRLFLARRNHRILAAGLVLVNNRTAHLFDAVSVSDRRLLLSRPNHAVLWKAIEWAHSAGCTTFDLGPNHMLNKGLCDYKSYWGAKPEPVDHYFADLAGRRIRSAEIDSPLYKIAKSALRVFPKTLYPLIWPLSLEAY